MSAPTIITAMADEIRSSGIGLADQRSLIFHLHGLRQFKASDIDKYFEPALKRAMGGNGARRAA